VTKAPTIITKVARSVPGRTRVITHRGVFRLRAGVQKLPVQNTEYFTSWNCECTMGQWKLMTGHECDELRMAWVMTYLLPVIATRRFSPRLWTSNNGNRVTDRWRTIVTKTSNGIRERKIPPRINKHRDMVVKTRRRQGAGVSLRGDLCYDSWSLSHLGYLYPGTTPFMIKLDHNRSYPRV